MMPPVSSLPKLDLDLPRGRSPRGRVSSAPGRVYPLPENYPIVDPADVRGRFLGPVGGADAIPATVSLPPVEIDELAALTDEPDVDVDDSGDAAEPSTNDFSPSLAATLTRWAAYYLAEHRPAVFAQSLVDHLLSTVPEHAVDFAALVGERSPGMARQWLSVFRLAASRLRPPVALISRDESPDPGPVSVPAPLAAAVAPWSIAIAVYFANGGGPGRHDMWKQAVQFTAMTAADDLAEVVAVFREALPEWQGAIAHFAAGWIGWAERQAEARAARADATA